MGMKKTEVGMIPEEWNVQIFSDTFRILNNNTFSRAELNYESGQFRNIHYGDVLIRFPEVLDCTRLDVPYINDDCRISGSAQALQDGDVVIADTAEDETVGKVTEVRNTVKKPVMAGLHTIPCRVKSGEFAPMWLGYYMNSHLYHDQLLPYIHGIKVSSVSKGSLAETVIIKPPIEEQKKIVAALSDMDALIKDTEKLIRKYQAVKQACLQRMFPQNGQNEPEMRLPGFTGAWEQRKLGELAQVCDSARIPNDEWAEEGIPYIRASDITNDDLAGVLFLAENIYEKYGAKTGSPSKGDVLFNGGGEIGKSVLKRDNKPLYVQGGAVLYVKTSESDVLSGEYLNAFFSSPQAKKYIESASAGGTMKHFTLGPSNVMPITYPSMGEQEKMGQFFDCLDHLITLHQRKGKLLKKASKYIKNTTDNGRRRRKYGRIRSPHREKVD